MLKNLFSRSLKKTGKSEGENSFLPEDTEKWSIGIYEGETPFQIQPCRKVSNPVLTAADVNDADASFVADPFMIRHKSLWYMFFEVDVRRKEGNIGKIGLATSPDGLEWQYEQIVLAEEHHLSYPYIFKSKNDIYMVPETRSIRSVNLYKAVDFPYKWKFLQTMIKGRRFADNTFFRFGGLWWLFTDSGNATLRLYYAEGLFSAKWKEHRKSPVVRKDNSMARPGGRVVMHNGKPVRLAQDGLSGYGSGVRGFEIEILSRSDYREREIPGPVIGASGVGWNRSGMHTVDLHRISGNYWFACVDGLGG
ncbi:MAG: hypothetical protein K9J83_00370 [Desulfarculaceae bacterium]|nr:hypothetical protein [Desulfarculaceae bacterium]